MRFLRVIRRFRNWHLHYLNQYGLLKSPHVELETRDGLRLKVRTGTSDFRTSRSVLVDRSYFFGGGGLPRDAVVIDAGAHMGCFTLLAASMAPDGRVFSFEPEPANFELLSENVRLNGFGHVKIFSRAVGGSAGPRALHYSRNPDTTGGHSLLGNGEPSITVDCTTLDRIVADHALERIDFLKLDCEGAELELLRAASPGSLAKLRRGALEVHSEENRVGVSKILTAAGLEIFAGPKPNYLYFRRS